MPDRVGKTNDLTNDYLFCPCCTGYLLFDHITPRAIMTFFYREKRIRKSFAKRDQVLDVPFLFDSAELLR